MKLKSVQKVMGGILGAAVLLGIPSCSDDHFDIKTQGAGNTIWQNIEANPELKDVAEILKEVKVYTKLEDKKRSMTYAELLNQPQSFTFFAPVNGSFDANEYLTQIEKIKTLRAMVRQLLPIPWNTTSVYSLRRTTWLVSILSL